MVNSETPSNQSQSLEGSNPSESDNTSELISNDNDKINSDTVDKKVTLTKTEFLDISKQIDNIEDEVIEWRAKREELNSLVMEKSKVRNQKNAEVKEHIVKANEEKKKRDEINTKLNELKPQKLAVDQEIQKYRKILDETDKKLENVPEPPNISNSKKSFYLLKKYEKEIKNLEWKLQTQTFSLEEERILVDRIADLDQKVEGLSEFKNLSKEKIKSFHNVRKLKNQMHKTIREMNGYVKESRMHHKKMVEAFSKANTVRKEADMIHADIQKIKTQADLIHSEFVEKIKLKRTLSNKIKKYSQKLQAEQKSRETEAIKEKTTNVLQKTKDGKKISFEDFKSLIDLGLI